MKKTYHLSLPKLFIKIWDDKIKNDLELQENSTCNHPYSKYYASTKFWKLLVNMAYKCIDKSNGSSLELFKYSLIAAQYIPFSKVSTYTETIHLND